VIGGIAVIAILVFLLWKFVLKGRRREPVPDWDPMDYPLEKPGENASVFARDARSRASTHTVTSMASTVLTRASNIIQIAYIPGVTNRQASNQASPSVLVPPVPPIPIPTTPSTHMSHGDQEHFFLPGDLRGSTYSDATSLGGGRLSIAPSLARASIASTVMPNSAVPTSVTKIKPSLVSVRSGSTATSPALTTPPVPSLDRGKYDNEMVVKPRIVQMPSRDGGSPASASGMKPTALTITRKIKAATQAASSSASSVSVSEKSLNHEPKPIGLGMRASKISSLAESNGSNGSPHARGKKLIDDSSEDDDEAHIHDRSRRSLLRNAESPFGDHAAIDESEDKQSVKDKGKGPFQDSNAL